MYSVGAMAKGDEEVTMKLTDERLLQEHIGSMIDGDEVIRWVRENLDPEDVFDSDVLKNWALDNGFKEDMEDRG